MHFRHTNRPKQNIMFQTLQDELTQKNKELPIFGCFSTDYLY